jgi:excisionase family DNA binding protein
MNKKTVAETLGVGIRAVERYAEQGRLTVRYEKGKTRPVAVYNDEEVQALKNELAGELYHIRPTLALEKSKSANPDQSPSGIVAFPAPAQALLAAMLEATRPPAATIGEKILLDLKDCAALTTLSEDYLKKAIRDGRLKGSKKGFKGYRVKRADLDEFIKKLKL